MQKYAHKLFRILSTSHMDTQLERKLNDTCGIKKEINRNAIISINNAIILMRTEVILYICFNPAWKIITVPILHRKIHYKNITMLFLAKYLLGSKQNSSKSLLKTELIYTDDDGDNNETKFRPILKK